jgi:hypothetical protein
VFRVRLGKPIKVWGNHIREWSQAECLLSLSTGDDGGESGKGAGTRGREGGCVIGQAVSACRDLSPRGVIQGPISPTAASAPYRDTCLHATVAQWVCGVSPSY